MNKKNQWKPKDSSHESIKVELRKKFLPPDSVVLDLFCGKDGAMYEGVYKSACKQYLGIDKKEPHWKAPCFCMDNAKFVISNDISKYNVIDLDAYGCPWQLLWTILSKHSGASIEIFATDGSPTKFSLGGNMPRIYAASEGVKTKDNIPGLRSWYTQIVSTLLKKIEAASIWKFSSVHMVLYDTVAYWHIRAEQK